MIGFHRGPRWSGELLAIGFVAGLAALLVFFALFPQRVTGPAAALAPGETVTVSLGAGSHALWWVGTPHRPQPSLDQLDLSAVDPARGVAGEVTDESSGLCDGSGACSLGALVVPAAARYDVTMRLRVADPDHGHLEIAERSGSSTRPGSLVAAAVGSSLLGLCVAAAIVVVIRAARASWR